MKTSNIEWLICSIITILIVSSTLVNFSDNNDHSLLEDSIDNSEVNSFNTSFQPTMPISSLNIPSWNDITNYELVNDRSHAYIQDFVQLNSFLN